MAYEVLGNDGKYTGPYDEKTILGWLSTQQLDQNVSIRDFQTGRVMKAGHLINPPKATSPLGVPTASDKKSFKEVMTATDGTAEFAGAIIFAIFTLVFCLFSLIIRKTFGFGGFVFASGSIVYAFRCHGQGYDKANWGFGFAGGAVLISAITMALIAAVTKQP
jgi:hypothetical protein